MKISLGWLLLLALVSCSGQRKKDISEAPQIELSDAKEFSDTEDVPVIAEAPVAEPVIAQENNQPEIITEDASPAVQNLGDAPVVAEPEKTYTVQKNETLMMIAFKLYGDYSKWRELVSYNKDLLAGSSKVKEGMEIKFLTPDSEFIWNPAGLPYLIRTGDTLGGISGNVYGTVQKWRSLWDNNRPLIKDPNRIFAGFTIYYREDGKVASQP
jgi:nucleoid-associated protein YgaU